jgi:hypothetical protein
MPVKKIDDGLSKHFDSIQCEERIYFINSHTFYFISHADFRFVEIEITFVLNQFISDAKVCIVE